jgi:hypothetical protein
VKTEYGSISDVSESDFLRENAMQRKRIRPLTAGLLICGSLIFLLCLWLRVGPYVHRIQVERAIRRFEARPSQAQAQSLADLLRNHKANEAQGARILALLYRPNVVLREAYSTGRPVTLVADSPFQLRFHRALWQQAEVSVNDQPRIRSTRFFEGPQFLQTPRNYMEPGTYPVAIHYKYSLGLEKGLPPSELGRLFQALLDRLGPLGKALALEGSRTARTYESDFTVSVEAIVVEQHQAPRIGQMSNPELDRKMRAAFRTRTRQTSTTVSTRTGAQRSITYPALHVQYDSLPIAVSFACTLQLSDGREIAHQGWYPERFRARAGSSDLIQVDIRDFRFHEPGHHTAKIVLKPDPELAYNDPTIDAIWNGTLEFPITFTITP